MKGKRVKLAPLGAYRQVREEGKETTKVMGTEWAQLSEE